MAATAWQWFTSLSAFTALVFGFMSFEVRYRDCMRELASGDALLNASLPALLMNPVS